MGLVNKKIITFSTRVNESDDEIKALKELNDKITKAIEKVKKGEPLDNKIKEILKMSGLGRIIGESVKHYKKINDGGVSRYKMVNEGSRKNRIQMSEITDAVEDMKEFVANSAYAVIERKGGKNYYCVYAYRGIQLLEQELDRPRNYKIFEPTRKNATIDEILKYIKIALGEWDEE